MWVLLIVTAVWLVALVPFLCLAVAAARGDEILAEQVEAQRAGAAQLLLLVPRADDAPADDAPAGHARAA